MSHDRSSDPPRPADAAWAASWLLPFALLFLAALGCAQPSGSVELKAVWQDGEECVYDRVARDGVAIGTSQWTWTRRDQGWVLTEKRNSGGSEVVLDSCRQEGLLLCGLAVPGQRRPAGGGVEPQGWERSMDSGH